MPARPSVMTCATPPQTSWVACPVKTPTIFVAATIHFNRSLGHQNPIFQSVPFCTNLCKYLSIYLFMLFLWFVSSIPLPFPFPKLALLRFKQNRGAINIGGTNVQEQLMSSLRGIALLHRNGFFKALRL